MKILKADFLEPVHSPVKVRGADDYQDKYRHRDEGPLRLRAFGPGLLLEADGMKVATVIPWANVRSALVELEEGDQKVVKK